MKKAQVILLIISWLFLGISDSSAQLYDSQNYVIKHWGMEDGLPQSSVNDIVQTKDGYLWMATFGGLVRFDGLNFKTFDRSNTSCLISDRFLRIFPDSDGGIWLFPDYTDITLVKFKDGRCLNYTIQTELTNYTEMIELENGQIWFIVDETFYRYEGESFSEVSILQDKQRREEALRAEGRWVGAGNHLYKIVNNEVILVSKDIAGKTSGILRTTTLDSLPNTLILGTGNEGVYFVDVEGSPEIEQVERLPQSHFLEFRKGENSQLFAQTAEGITVLTKEGFVPLSVLNETTDARLKTILQDDIGNYWIGTEGDGLYRVSESFITMIDESSGLNNSQMLSLTSLSNGTKLLATNCGGVYEWDGARARLSSIHKYHEPGCHWAVFEDSKKRIWLGSGGPYMIESLDEPGYEFTEKDGYVGFGIFAIDEMSDGSIWIGSGQGLNIYDGNNFQRITTKDGLYYDDARVFFEDEDGTIWVGTKGGLNIYKEGKFQKYPLIESSKSDVEAQPEIRAIYKDSDGYFWIGTYGFGLFRLKGHEIIQFTTTQGLFDNVVSHVIEDEFGYFWMGSNRGISRVQRAHLNEYADGKISEFPVYSYGINDGMNTAETNGGFLPTTIYENGSIYFPTVDGVAIVNTRLVGTVTQSPEVYVEEIRTSDSLYVNADILSLKYNDTFLQINYTAVELSDPEKISFKYKIEGYHDQWIEVGNQRQAIFTNIPPGSYTFKVRASDRNGMWEDAKTATFGISVIPPFWQTTWFYIMIGFLFIAAGPISYYIRTRALLAENERQKRFSEELMNSQENERHRIASELHDSLGQQILVIKNRAELAKLSQQTQPELVEQLDEIVKSAQISIDSVRSISHNLRPVHLEKFGITEAIESLCMEMQGSTNIEWTYELKNIDGVISKEKEISFYRVIQEALNNILKHSEATEASVQVSILPKKVVVGIADNGKGFEREKIDEISNLGFLGMKERVQNFGGTFAISTFPGKGTLLTITIPIEL
ncbi:MAG: hypothetical protein JJ966_01645 [Balneolaceae bacterium]|nr:hypothetical protein [Balneolaceae bacterium]